MKFFSAYNLYKKHQIIPAFNLRLLTYDSAKALFRAAKKRQTNLFIIELAQSEIGYTKQSPKGFAQDILKAAKAENYQEPIYLQADHYKPTSKRGELEKLIKKAIKAGFYNVDIDCSTLPLERNIQETNYYFNFVKKNQPKLINVNVGGEIGEIGGQNTKPEDLQIFLQKVKGINKIAAQTGTAHGKGGQIDWDLLRELSQIAQSHGLAGIVQHGASTLKENDLRKLKENGVCEVHLATEIMNVVLKHPKFPFKIEKKQIGQFKKKINKIPQEIKDEISSCLEKKFVFFFDCLR